jgi:hypothetical protein
MTDTGWSWRTIMPSGGTDGPPSSDSRIEMSASRRATRSSVGALSDVPKMEAMSLPNEEPVSSRAVKLPSRRT